MAKALFITFEGGEGVGKSTQVRRLVERLKQSGLDAIGTREPGGSPKAEEIRAVLLSGAVLPLGTSAEAILFAAARADHLRETIRPALAGGVTVVCDRFLDSTAAYQGVLGQVPNALVSLLERVVVGATRPDLTFVLDLPASLGLARARARRTVQDGPDRFEEQDQEFHDKIREAFRTIAAAEPDRCLLVDAREDADSIAATVWNAVKARLDRAANSRSHAA